MTHTRGKPPGYERQRDKLFDEKRAPQCHRCVDRGWIESNPSRNGGKPCDGEQPCNRCKASGVGAFCHFAHGVSNADLLG